MDHIESHSHLSLPRLMLIASSLTPAVGCSIFWYLEVVSDFLTPIEAITVPSFCCVAVLFTAMFAFLAKQYLTPLFSAYKIIGGVFILSGLVEGALTYDSHVRFFLMWLPFFYVGVIFASASVRQRLLEKFTSPFQACRS